MLLFLFFYISLSTVFPYTSSDTKAIYYHGGIYNAQD